MPEQDTAESALPLRAQGLSRSYGTLAAVDRLDLELRCGEVLGLLGPNGAGKTTTMQMLTGNLAPSVGSISICGIDLLKEPKAAKARLGYLPETPPLYPEFTVDEYLTLAARLHRVAKGDLAAAVEKAKARCGLSQVSKRLIGALSKGYQQRVGIAQAIVHNPEVIVLDEPTVGLDPNQIREIRALIRELGREKSVLLSTHILPEVESVCDRVQILHHGRMVYSDAIHALKQFRGGDGLLVGLRQPPQESEIAAIPGITGIQRVSDTMFRLYHDPDTDPTEAIVKSATGGWGLYQISPAQTSLEEVFVQLTQHEET
ncbi:MAG: ATP-binding cassette domain-containing protein [Pseudomonadota bacterium]